jgi:hypothetical protein
MHLARKAYSANACHFARICGGKIVDSTDRRIGPGIRILLGPERGGMEKRKLAQGGCDGRASLVHEHGFHAGRADVHSEIHETSSRPALMRRANCVALSRKSPFAEFDLPFGRLGGYHPT